MRRMVGMSNTPRRILGLAALVCTIGFVGVSFWSPPALLFAGFTSLIFAACFFSTGRSKVVRIIGAVVLLASSGNVLAQWNTPDLYRSLVGMTVLGLPAAYVAIWGEYPSWGRDAIAFRDDMRPPHS